MSNNNSEAKQIVNYKAILHLQDSQYCYATDDRTVKIMIRTSSDDKFDSVNLIYGNKYDYYSVQRKAELKKSFTDKDYDYYTLTLKLDDVRFVYIFELKYNGRVYYFSEDGISETYDFSLAYYNSFQLPYINKIDTVKPVQWMKNAVFYEIFIDRFNRGNSKKDCDYINLKWGDIPNPKSFAGGDLEGVIQKLDYLKKLGITALYLTPIFRSISNHKYDISDYMEIDPQFGDKKTFKRLVAEAHSRGIKVVLDAVFNHCSENLTQFQDVIKNGVKSPYYDWFIVHGDKVDNANYEYFGVCSYMPKINTSNKDVQKFLIEIATYWIKEFDIDGWRLDVSDEVSHDFWRHFREAVKTVKEDCIILGENWHDSHPYLRGDQFDGIMNYALTKACTDYFISNTLDADGFAKRLGGLYIRNTSQVNSMMLNLLDSHDTHRFYTLAKKDIDKLICALSVIYMHTGAALIYYGTEVPLEGGYDPDCRRTMDWSVESKPTYVKQICEKLAALREYDALMNGEISFGSCNGMFILERFSENYIIKLTVNNSDKSKPFKISGKEILSHNFKDGVIGKVGFVVEKIEREVNDG